MTDTRKPIFDAVRAAGGTFPSQTAVDLLDNVLTRLGVPKVGIAPDDGSELPADYWPLLAQIESGNNPMAKAATSSASGLYQFIRGTWVGEGGAWGRDMSRPFGGLSPSRDEQTKRAMTFTEKNARILRTRGVGINKATLYAAHFLGAGMAATLLSNPNDASAERIAGPDATKANPTILRGKTVGQFKDWLRQKTGDAA